jgi:16S rRNA (uracil1498-N3)-methyltransferase
MADRFYTSSNLGHGPVLLQGPEAHHLTTVCRFRPGDRVALFNGDGREYIAEVESADRKRVALTIVEVLAPRRELPFRLELAAPLPKGDRADFLIEKLTELGVTDFVPLRTERSVVHPRETKLDRLQRAVIEASKQCGRNVLMRIHELTDWTQYCRKPGGPAARFIAHPAGPAGGFENLTGDRCCVVGPEGGFTEEEIAAALAAGWQQVGLGPRILRLETAALALAVLAGDASLAGNASSASGR